MAQELEDSAPEESKRQDTSLEAEGAEFLVLGHLLLSKIVANKAYSNTADYDIIASTPERNVAVTIQVKSRWKTWADGFPIRAVKADFVVLAQLNRGKTKTSKNSDPNEPQPPVFFVLPKEYAESRLKNLKIRMAEIDKFGGREQFQDNWQLIRNKLSELAEKRNSL